MKLLMKKELYTMNTIAVKSVKQKREYTPTIGNTMIIKEIKRTKYLKICWMCSSVFESYKINAVSCCPRCAQNIWYAKRIGLNPPVNMQELTKPKNTKDIKVQFGYL